MNPTLLQNIAIVSGAFLVVLYLSYVVNQSFFKNNRGIDFSKNSFLFDSPQKKANALSAQNASLAQYVSFAQGKEAQFQTSDDCSSSYTGDTGVGFYPLSSDGRYFQDIARLDDRLDDESLNDVPFSKGGSNDVFALFSSRASPAEHEVDTPFLWWLEEALSWEKWESWLTCPSFFAQKDESHQTQATWGSGFNC